MKKLTIALFALCVLAGATNLAACEDEERRLPDCVVTPEGMTCEDEER